MPYNMVVDWKEQQIIKTFYGVEKQNNSPSEYLWVIPLWSDGE